MVFFLFCFFSCIPENVTEGTTTTTLSNFVQFSPIGGVFKNSVTVTMKSKSNNIYYTLDGTKPSISSAKYSSPIELTTDALVRALSIVNGEEYYSMTCYNIDKVNDFSESRMASPNWQDQVIYFIMIDRFFNGDSGNDIQDPSHASILYGDKTQEKFYNGGDLKGIQQKLNYIKNLGATAIWITPPVKNQWYEGNYNGYHGYWASNFMNTDPHFGTIEEYASFVKAAHDAGLYVIQDIVVNHVGDYFTVKYSPIIDPQYAAAKWNLNSESLPLSTPEQIPWKFNNPTIFTLQEFQNNSFYHWAPAISNYNDPNQLLTYQMSNLDDINTNNQVVRNLLRGYFRFWIDKVDIDGYRVDTVKYVEPDFFEDFVNSTEKNNKGIRQHAKDLGKSDFIVFGEAWSEKDEDCVIYTKSPTGKPRMDSSIYFPLAFAIRTSFIGGGPTSKITDILKERYSVGYLNPDKLVTFVDNHDMARSLAGASAEVVKAAYALIFTIPGIPQIYYGTEQGFTVTRSSMMAGCYKKDGEVNATDLFDEGSEWFLFFKNLINLRKSKDVFRYGKVTVFADDVSGPGILAYKVIKGNGGVGNEAVVVINTSSNDKALPNVSSGLRSGNIYTKQSVFVGSVPDTIQIGNNGKFSMAVPAKSFGIYVLTEEGNPPPPPTNVITLTITNSSPTNPKTLYTGDNLEISGTLTTPANIRVFLDGEYNSVSSFAAGTTWSKSISLNAVSNGIHTVAALIDTGDPNTYIFSEQVLFIFEERYTEVISVSDPEGDDKGPSGHSYTLPTHSSYSIHPQDILNVRVYTAASNMKVEFTMKGTSNIWNPNVNNFDHVEFNIFLQKPSSDSTADIHPFYNYTLPSGFKWDYLIKEEGWSATMYSKNGASTNNYGTPISPAPASEVDHTNKKITFTIKGSSIGSPSDLHGWKIYVATWDRDMGNPRGLTINGGEWRFGGGDGNVDPLVIDETSIITLP